MANEKQQDQKQPSKRIVEAGLAPHMSTLQHLFGNQSKLTLTAAASGRPAGAPRAGKVVESMRLTPRGLEVRMDGRELTIGQGSWTYILEQTPEADE